MELTREVRVTWRDPKPDFVRMRRESGLDYLLGMFPPGPEGAAPIGRLLQIHPVEFRSGFAAFEAIPGEQHYNPIGSVHGGYAATLLDSAMGCAIHTRLRAGKNYTTIDLRVSFVKAIQLKCGVLRCEATVLSMGGRVATAEAKIIDAAGQLYAHGTATCLILTIPNEG